MENKEPVKLSPEVSIIIPTYNRETYIEDLVLRIKNQTVDNFECIIIDDGSTDQTGILCDSLTAGDKHFVVKHTANFGVSHARNIALDIARGKYITFIDSDDSIPDDYLEKLISRIKMLHVDMVIGSFCRIHADGKKEKVNYPFEDRIYLFDELLPSFARIQKEYGVFGWSFATLFQRKCVLTNRFDESLRLAEDFDFYLRIYPQIHTVYYDNSCEYCYSDSAENSTGKVDDDDIDYLSQLNIFLRYKMFLENAGVFYGENEQIVTEQIRKYAFFAVFHSKLSCLHYVFQDACRLIKQSGIKQKKTNGLMGIVLNCIFTENEKRAVRIMTIYRVARKLLKGH